MRALQRLRRGTSVPSPWRKTGVSAASWRCVAQMAHGSCALDIFMGTQNHEKWRFYTPNIWVITPKNEGCGFPWWPDVNVETVRYNRFISRNKPCWNETPVKDPETQWGLLHIGRFGRQNSWSVEVGTLSRFIQGFIHSRWLAGFLPSTVWWVIDAILFWDVLCWSFLKVRKGSRIMPTSNCALHGHESHGRKKTNHL